MRKPLAGRRAFEAMGRSAASRGEHPNHSYRQRRVWLEWAVCAWARGWLVQQPMKNAKD